MNPIRLVICAALAVLLSGCVSREAFIDFALNEDNFTLVWIIMPFVVGVVVGVVAWIIRKINLQYRWDLDQHPRVPPYRVYAGAIVGVSSLLLVALVSIILSDAELTIASALQDYWKEFIFGTITTIISNGLTVNLGFGEWSLSVNKDGSVNRGK